MGLLPWETQHACFSIVPFHSAVLTISEPCVSIRDVSFSDTSDFLSVLTEEVGIIVVPEVGFVAIWLRNYYVRTCTV